MSRLLWLIAVSSLPVGAQSAAATVLEPGKQVEGRAEAGKVQRYAVPLEAGEFARIVIDRHADTALRIQAPDGAEVLKYEAVEHNGPVPVFMIAKAAGQYSVEVEPGEMAGRYGITLVERHKAAAADELRLQAQSEWSAGLAALKPGEGLERLKRSSDLFRQAQEEPGLLESLLSLADKIYESELPKQGRAYAEEAITLAVKQNNGYAESEARFLLAKLFVSAGSSADGITQLEKAIAISTELNDPAGLGKALNLTGSIYSAMGQRARALQYYSRSLPILRELGVKRWIASAQFSIGRTLTAMGRDEQGAKPLEEALAMYRGLGDKPNEALVLQAMADGASGKDDRRAASLLEQAVAIYRELRSDRATARALTSLAAVRGSSGDWPGAAKLLEQALELQKQSGAAIDTAQTRILLSRTETRSGHAERARKLAEDALADLEGLAERTGGIEAQATYFAGFRAAYSALVDAHRASGNESAAFQASERSRARGLAAMIGARKIDLGSGVDAGLRERASKLEKALASKLRAQTALERRAHKKEDAEALMREISELRHQQDRLQAEIRKAHPNYASITQYAPLDVEHLRKDVLDDDTALVEYMISQRRSYVWVVTREGVTGADLPARAVIDKLARESYDALTARNRQGGDADVLWDQKARELSAMLLKPAAAAFEKKRWMVVADETLHYVPFAALAPEKVIVNLPSAAVLGMIRETSAGRKTPSKTLAVFADPVFEKDDARATAASQTRAMERGQLVVTRLPFTRREAEAITAGLPKPQVKLLSGFEATRAAATDASLADYRILHFATHGILNEDAPELSGIVLSLFDSKGQPQDGFVRLHDIYNMKLPVDLVVLSACQTGLGKKMDGEGLIGLTRGMMYAGAARVVASLWKVDDSATAELMKYFYKAMLEEGKPAAEALHAAQQQLAGQRRWRSPYYWAAFQLHGEYR